MPKKNQSIQLQEQLLPKKSSNNTNKSKNLVDTFKSLFDNDNMKNFTSNKIIQQLGGIEGLEEKLKSNRNDGISATADDKKDRIKKYGKNDPFVKPAKTLWEMVVQNFEDPMLRILCVAATVSLVLGIASHGWQQGWIEGFSILLAVAIITVVNVGNNYEKQQQFRKLNEVASIKNINVIRGGITKNMSVFELLVGDVVLIQTGQILSVDGIVLKSNHLQIDESAMTGESVLVKKQQFTPNSNKQSFLVSGTKVVAGTGLMMVLTVGKNTYENILKQKLMDQTGNTPLQQKLQVLGNQIGQFGFKAAGLTFIALCGHLIYDTMQGKHQWFSIQFINDLVQYFITAVTIIVMAVPQGLPLAVSISLAYSVNKMKDQNNLVRYLAACQTMGGANNICSDKTGTLTKNLMSVTRFWGMQKQYDKFQKNQIDIPSNILQILNVGIALNSDAHPTITKGKFQQIGNKTECALLQMAYKMGYNFQQIRKREKDIIATIPFSSDRKRMSVIYKQSSNNKYYISSKGAPQILLQQCSTYINKSGKIVPITSQFKDIFNSTILGYSKQCLRNILLCYKEINFNADQINNDPLSLEKDLTIIGVVGIKDPLKQAVPQAVLKCKKAGITVRMVTGDNTETALAIAKQAHILPSQFQRPQNEGDENYYAIMQGRQFRQLVGQTEDIEEEEEQNESQQQKDDHKQKAKHRLKNIQKFKQIIADLRVLARSSPTDKYILAIGLKQLGNVVAMTGDGTNDAPALKNADIGFAMNLTGTEVAKDAADIILLDDNFSSIITAIKYGRNIFDCIRKFLQFQLTVNVVGMTMAFIGAVILKQSPLTPVQILWINLIMDTLAALALATQAPSDQLLKRMPYERKEDIITTQMYRNIVVNSAYQIFILCVVLFKGGDYFDVPDFRDFQPSEWNNVNGQHLSIFFNIFVFFQVFNFFNSRKLKKNQMNVFQNCLNNYLFVLIIIVIFIIQIIIIQIGGKSFMLVPLSFDQHLQCIIIGATIIPYIYVAKIIIPESFLNSFALLKQQKKVQFYDVDSNFRKWMKQPLTELRNSRTSRRKDKKKDKK